MRNKKIISTLITLFFGIGFYVYDNYKTNPIVKPVLVTNSEFNYLPSSTTGVIISHQFYTLSYNEKYEQAEWVAYQLTSNQIISNHFKRPYFIQDPLVKTGSAHYWNFKNSGYTKGHLCPAADRDFSEKAFDETFYTSNISPQTYEFNSGVWERLEQKVRYWATKYKSIYVITGPVLTSNLNTIGSEKVAVPKYFYKIILDLSSSKPKAIAFLIPHKNSEEALYKFVTSIDSIEKLTHIDFFPALQNSLENNLEKTSNYKDWIF